MHANLLMMSPCHCHLIFLSPIYHHHHHHHHFHYASLHLCSIPDSKLIFSIHLSHHSLPHLFGRISRILATISGLNCRVKGRGDMRKYPMAPIRLDGTRTERFLLWSGVCRSVFCNVSVNYFKLAALVPTTALSVSVRSIACVDTLVSERTSNVSTWDVNPFRFETQ